MVEGSAREQVGERAPLGPFVPDDDPGRVEIVVEGAPFTEELGGEDDPIGAQLRPEAPREADRNGGLDDGRRRGAIVMTSPTTCSTEVVLK